MTVQYDARRDVRGWTVFDRWTGEPVVLTHATQTGLPWFEADELADRLNRLRPTGDRNGLR